jgi:membrane fusion protein (multidrug efflux system)
VRAGGKARFSVAGIDRRFEGEIYAIDPRVDPATRTLLLRAISENTDGRLVPGTFAGVEFTLTEVEGAILVPSVAIIPGVSERYVFVAEGGKAVRRTIEVGNRTETAVHVLSGVRAGERVITSGIQQLRNGLAISVSPDPGATARNLANASAASTAAAAP